MNDSSTTVGPNGPGAFLSPLNPAPDEDLAFTAILQDLVTNIVLMPGNLVRPRWLPIPVAQPEPSVDWCAIGPLDDTPESNISTVHASTGGPIDGFDTTYEVDTVDVLASFYGPNCRGNAKLLRIGLMIPQNREALYLKSIALVGMPGRVIGASETVNLVNVLRADMHFMLRRRIARTWPIDNLLEAQGVIYTTNGDAEPFDANSTTGS